MVERWIASDDANKKYFEHFRIIWEESRRLAAKSTVDENAAWQRFQSRVNGQKPVEQKVVKMQSRRWLSIAALFVVIAGAALMIYLSQQEPAIQQLAIQTTNNVAKDTLSDGSVITLNKQSSLLYPESFEKDSLRKVALKGEAFFAITPNKKQPFVIEVGDVQVRVVGTSFNIRSDSVATEVIVETGIVQVITKAQVVTLRPKEKVVVKREDQQMVKDEVQDKLYNYYQSKEFVCDNTPLWKLVDVINKAYEVNIVIENKSLRDLRLNTTFNNESLSQVLAVISETFSIKVIEEKDRIVLK